MAGRGRGKREGGFWDKLDCCHCAQGSPPVGRTPSAARKRPDQVRGFDAVNLVSSRFLVKDKTRDTAENSQDHGWSQRQPHLWQTCCAEEVAVKRRLGAAVNPTSAHRRRRHAAKELQEFQNSSWSMVGRNHAALSLHGWSFDHKFFPRATSRARPCSPARGRQLPSSNDTPLICAAPLRAVPSRQSGDTSVMPNASRAPPRSLLPTKRSCPCKTRSLTKMLVRSCPPASRHTRCQRGPVVTRDVERTAHTVRYARTEATRGAHGKGKDTERFWDRTAIRGLWGT